MCSHWVWVLAEASAKVFMHCACLGFAGRFRDMQPVCEHLTVDSDTDYVFPVIYIYIYMTHFIGYSIYRTHKLNFQKRAVSQMISKLVKENARKRLPFRRPTWLYDATMTSNSTCQHSIG